jgi:hypothetical protein
MDVARLMKKALALLENGSPFETIYPVLRKVTPELEKLYGKVPFPCIRLVVDDCGFWHLWTTVPDVDCTHEAWWNDKVPLSADEDTELRNHLVFILKLWIAEDELFTPPMEMQEAVKLLQIGIKPTKKPSMESRVKTLNRHIADGMVRAIKLNKNLVRILKTDIRS